METTQTIDRVAIRNAALRQTTGLERAKEAYEAVRGRYADMLGSLGLNEGEFLTLLYITRRGVQTLRAISRERDEDRERSKRVVKALERRGLVNIRGAERNYWRIWPTDEGARLVARALMASRALDEERTK